MSADWRPQQLARGEGRVRLDRRADLTELVLDHARARNAVSPGMMADLDEALLLLQASPPRALILRGEGTQAFCAGGDLAAVRGPLLGEGVAAGMQTFMSGCLARLEALPCLVVGAVEGVALGGGAELLMACDLVVAGRSARVGFVQARLGLSPGWGGGLRLLRRVGRVAALRLLLEAEPLDAASAQSIGLFDEVVDDGEAAAQARTLAHRLCRHAPQAVAAALRLVRSGSAEEERRVFVELWGGDAHREALAALTQGRR